MSTSSALPSPAPSPAKCANRPLLSALLFVGLSDFLLWPATPGLSFALWIAAFCAALFLNRPLRVWNAASMVLAGLLAATAVQSAVEISLSNVLVAAALMIGMMGETAYPMLPAGWARCSEAMWALLKAPGRWGWASGAVARGAWANRGFAGGLLRIVRIGFPALVVCTAFIVLFSFGNAIFGRGLTVLSESLFHWIGRFDLSLPHLLFYGVLATFSLVLLHPAPPGQKPRIWTREIPKLAASNPSLAWWRSMVMLGALNLLFFAVNTIDALYLWSGGEIPDSVTYSQYVHEGVASLVVAVLLSAFVLAALFQQAAEVAGSRGLKWLGHLWIAQNLVLIGGVMLRLGRYVDAYQLTTQRVYVGCFLLLVSVGFLLLALHIARGQALNRLLLHNGIATLGLFFGLQFLDVAGWVARANVARWERDPGRVLDLNYLAGLGPSAWPALAHVAKLNRIESRAAGQRLAKIRRQEDTALSKADWRSWQGRRAAQVARLRDSR